MITRAAVVAEAQSWLGTRFHHQASVKGVGVDCIGLVAGVAAALHMPEAQQWLQDVRRLSYTRAPDPAMLLAAAADYLIEIPIEALRAADIPLMRVRATPQHFGIITGDAPRMMIHAHAPVRRVVECAFAGEWSNACHRAFRYKALA